MVDWKAKIDAASLAEITAVFSALVYFTGYLISSLYVRSRGINQMSLVSTQYIETGFVFVLLTAIFIVVPLIIFTMALDSRKRHGYPSLALSLVFPIVTSNYLYVFVFFCLFVTRYEWLLRFPVVGCNTGLIQCFVFYTAALFVLQVAFLCLKYGGVKSSQGKISKLDAAETRPIFVAPRSRAMAATALCASLLVTVWFDYVLFTNVGWFPEFMSRAAAYIFCIVLIIGVIIVVRWLSQIYEDMWKRWKFWCVGGPLLLALYYFAVSSYEFGVYINIPISRGGKYPITTTTLHFTPESSHAMGGVESMTVYVIEETADRYYAISTDVQNWFQDHPSVDGISKSEVAFPHYDHLHSGQPRINHLRVGARSEVLESRRP